jgi:hypothetical protein
MKEEGSEINLKFEEEKLYREVQSFDHADPERLKHIALAALEKVGR